MVRKIVRNSAVLLGTAGATLTAAVACGDEPTGPMDAVAGAYEAAEWIITNDTDSRDLDESGREDRHEMGGSLV
ncbi:MAG: hypothetical protein ACODAA_02225 [Gemmatimonadota bacterium]